MIICITGLPAAGKSTAGKILARMGFRVYELGDIIREMMVERHVPINPDTDKEFTIWLRKRYGNLVTVRQMSREVKLREGKKTAIVGVRSKPELDYIRKYGDAVTIAVVAPIRLRYRRMVKRGRPDAPRSLAEFESRDKKEERFGLMAAIKSADYIVSGAGSITGLRRSISEILKVAK